MNYSDSLCRIKYPEIDVTWNNKNLYMKNFKTLPKEYKNRREKIQNYKDVSSILIYKGSKKIPH